MSHKMLEAIIIRADLMNLDEWVDLSPKQRDERRQRWISYVPVEYEPLPEEVEWRDLVYEAERRFSAQFGLLPEILCICSSCRFDDPHSVGISVRTRLFAGRFVRELPDDFLSFPVEQEPLGDEVEAFKGTWSAILSRLFEWHENVIRNWIADQDRVFRSVWFLHDFPWDKLPQIELARSAVGLRETSELMKIARELVDAIAVGGRFYLDQEPDYDWVKARERIAEVIRKYSSK